MFLGFGLQRLLAAKRDLRLAAELKRLDRIEALILDALGYVQQSREERPRSPVIDQEDVLVGVSTSSRT